jgi:hypothetical protein
MMPGARSAIRVGAGMKCSPTSRRHADIRPYTSARVLTLCQQQAETFTPPDAALAAEGNITWDDNVRGDSGPVQYSYPNYFYPGSGE